MFDRAASQIVSLALALLVAGGAASQPITTQITPYAPRTAAGPVDGAAAPAASAARAPINVGPAPGTAPALSSSVGGHDGAATYDYVLGPGDKIRISVFGEETLSGEFTVAGNGDVSFPLIGEIKAAGATVEALRTSLVKALKSGYLKDPRVSAEVVTFRPYYIFGEVAKPGEYPYIDRITVINAIATAGGFSYRANRKYVFIKRVNDAKEHRANLTDSLSLAPGDTVRVTERFF